MTVAAGCSNSSAGLDGFRYLSFFHNNLTHPKVETQDCNVVFIIIIIWNQIYNQQSRHEHGQASSSCMQIFKLTLLWELHERLRSTSDTKTRIRIAYQKYKPFKDQQHWKHTPTVLAYFPHWHSEKFTVLTKSLHYSSLVAGGNFSAVVVVKIFTPQGS